MSEQVFDKKEIQEAISRVDQAIAQLAVNRQVHITLTQDIRLIQQYCMQVFAVKEEPEDGGTNIIPIDTESGDENIEGSGDSV